MRLRGPVAPIMKRHPLTGEIIEPVGVVNGKVIYPICGGAEGDDDDDDKDDDADDSGAGSDNNDKDDAGSDSGDLSEEVERLRKRMQAADKRAEAAEKKIREQEDAKKDELTKATERAQELETALEEKDKTIRTLRLQNAFLTANKHSWHDPDTALDLAERNGYIEDVVDDDGNVDKVKLGKALDRLAKEKAFLVRSKEKDDDDQGEPSGEPAGGRSDNSKDERAKKQQLRSRFPVLNQR